MANSNSNVIKRSNMALSDAKVAMTAATDIVWIAARIRDASGDGMAALEGDSALLFASRVMRANGALHEACIRILKHQHKLQIAPMLNNYESMNAATKRGVFTQEERDAYDVLRVLRNRMSHAVDVDAVIQSILSHPEDRLCAFADQLESLGHKVKKAMQLKPDIQIDRGTAVDNPDRIHP